MKSEGPPAEGTGVDTARSGLLLAATVALAAAGPAIVVADRWLGLRRSSQYLTAFADRIPMLADVNLPDYAAVIAAAFLLLVVLGAFRSGEWSKAWKGHAAFARRPRRPSASQRQRAAGTAIALSGAAAAAFLFVRLALAGRIPGPELLAALAAIGVGMVLREVGKPALGRLWRRKRAVLLSILAAHVTVILAFATVHTYHRFELLLTALAALAVANLAARWRKTGPIPLLVVAAVCLYLWRVDAWWFSLVGDEYRNYDLAQHILEQGPAYVGSHLFQLAGGLEGLDPFADSLVQAVSMRVLGVNSFGWRFSSLYCAALALAFFWRFFRTFLSRRAALATTVVLGASHYIIAFGKIGYDKFQAYLAMAMLLAAAACAVRTRRTVAFVGVGFAAGLCFWVYPAALYVLPLPFFLLVLYARPIDRQTLARWVVAGIVTLLTMFPLPFQPTYFEGKRPGTVYYNPELTASTQRLVSHFRTNAAYVAFSPVLLGSEDHFVTSSYLDPLTGTLYIVGLTAALWLLRRDRFVAFLLLSLGFLLLIAGTTHDREYPPTTRMFLLLPLFCLLATAGLWRLLALARAAGVPERAARLAVAATLVAVVALNAVQAHVVSVRRSDGYQVLDPIIVRLARRIESLPPPQRPALVMLSPGSEDGGGISILLDVYDLHESAKRFSTIAVGGGALGPADLARIADPGAAVFVSPQVSPESRENLERQIAAAGKTPCSALTTTGKERFRVWTSEGIARPCDD